jgi:hypothetical protein
VEERKGERQLSKQRTEKKRNEYDKEKKKERKVCNLAFR